MATLRAYPNGLTVGMNSRGGNPNPPKRGEVVGWSTAAVRRHKTWLYSIDAPALDGCGWAVTLTLRDCPPDAATWQLVRNRWLERVRVMGATRWHWVVEWQRRGVPHIHAAVYVPQGDAKAGARLLRAWTECAAVYGPGWTGQTAKRIDGPLGWLQYLSKHCARGVQHYQRQGKPEGWTKTGRLWGYGGQWPALEPIGATITPQVAWRFRRLARSWRIADARKALARAQTIPEIDAARRRIAYARRMLKCPDKSLSRFRGVSEWIPENVTSSACTRPGPRPPPRR